MRVSVFGIGYVGAVVSGCLSRQGHTVTAVDVNEAKVRAINAGQSPISEPGLPEIVAAARESGLLSATTDAKEAINASEVTFICVGTPGHRGGRLDMSHVVTVSEQIGRLVGEKTRRTEGRHTIVMRSTMLPGTMDEVVVPSLERASDLKAGIDFGVGYLPEFLREGQGIADFERPSLAVIGGADPETLEVLRTLSGAGEKIFECNLRTAEAIKASCNAWHATKIAFANEIGAICQAYDLDGREVMNILCADTKLNVSRAYMRPGFAFGGSCLPKDVRALVHHAQSRHIETQLLSSLLPSNESQIRRAIEMVEQCGHREVALLGLTFKPETDDLRDSPLVELAERLIGKGYNLKIFDPSFSYERITGRNRQFLLTALPHIATLLAESMDAAVAHAQTIIVGHGGNQFDRLPALITNNHQIIDLSGAIPDIARRPNYSGFCW